MVCVAVLCLCGLGGLIRLCVSFAGSCVVLCGVSLFCLVCVCVRVLCVCVLCVLGVGCIA